MNTVATILMAGGMLASNTGEFIKKSSVTTVHHEQPAFFARINRLNEANGELLKINARTALIAERSQQLQVELDDTKEELSNIKNRMAVAAGEHARRNTKMLGLAGVLGVACVVCALKPCGSRTFGSRVSRGSDSKVRDSDTPSGHSPQHVDPSQPRTNRHETVAGSLAAKKSLKPDFFQETTRSARG